MAERPGQQPELASSALPLPQAGDLIAGKYRVDGALGEGGMGVVLAARHETLGQAVAIKFLLVRDEQYRYEASERLLREARAVAALKGEHVVRVFDVGETADGLPFIVMERLDGFDLGRLTGGAQRLPPSIACNLVLQACRAVEEAHRAGIVHRDLKPSNLFAVRRADNRVLLKVLDFGISKSLHQPAGAPITLTGEKMALGSPHYMSPEQVRDARAVDRRTDVWSLGVILYEFMAGRPVFQANSYPGLFAAIVSDSPLPLTEIRPEVSTELAFLVRRCLERDPAARPQSAAELAQELMGFAARDVDYEDLQLRATKRAELGQLLTQSGTQATQQSVEPPAGSQLPRSPIKPEPLQPIAPLTRLASDTRTQVSGSAPQIELSAPSSTAVSVGPQSGGDWPTTQRSPSIERQPAQPAAAAPASPTQRRLIPIACALLAIAAVVIWRVSQHTATPIAPTAAAPKTSWLAFESSPPGATVCEQEHCYGATPLRVTLPANSAGAQTRMFILKLDGYRPYVVEQAARDENMLIHAELVREASPASAPATAAPTSSAAPVVPPRPPAAGALMRRPAPIPASTPTTATAAAPPEIRTTR